jgi:hypothetical protein
MHIDPETSKLLHVALDCRNIPFEHHGEVSILETGGIVDGEAENFDLPLCFGLNFQHEVTLMVDSAFCSPAAHLFPEVTHRFELLASVLFACGTLFFLK